MTIPIACPECGKNLAVAYDLAGQFVRCPGCSRPLSVPGKARSIGITARKVTPRLAEREEDDLPRVRKKSRPSSSGSAALVVGIITLVLGMVALAFSWIPFICVVGVVLAGLGLIAGVVGVVLGLIQKGLGLWLSLAGGLTSLLALIVAIAMTIRTDKIVDSMTPPRAPMATPASSEPPAGTTLPGWGQVYDPDGDCGFAPQEARLNITVPGTAHDLSAEMGQVNAPRVLQEVEGDFTAEVKVCGVIHPNAIPTVFGHTPYQAGGLLLYLDSRNYVRLERAALFRDGEVHCFASFEQRGNGVPIFPTAAQPLPEGDVFLRLERQGNQVLAFVRVPGQEEVGLMPLTINYPSKVQIGVAVVNAAALPLSVHFEQFTVKKK